VDHCHQKRGEKISLSVFTSQSPHVGVVLLSVGTRIRVRHFVPMKVLVVFFQFLNNAFEFVEVGCEFEFQNVSLKFDIMRTEVRTSVTVTVALLWALAAVRRHRDGSSLQRTVGTYLPVYTASYSRRQQLLDGS
jgi:hypothetical protein